MALPVFQHVLFPLSLLATTLTPPFFILAFSLSQDALPNCFLLSLLANQLFFFFKLTTRTTRIYSVQKDCSTSLVLSRWPLADHHQELCHIVTRENIHCLLGFLTDLLSSHLTAHFSLPLTRLSLPGRGGGQRAHSGVPTLCFLGNDKGHKVRNWQFIIWVTAGALIRQELTRPPGNKGRAHGGLWAGHRK